MDDELTVLDYVKALLTPWRGAPPTIPPLEEAKDGDPDNTDKLEEPSAVEMLIPAEQPVPITPGDIPEERTTVIPWRAIIAVGLALAAQISLEPGTERSWGLGLGLYIAAAALVIWANYQGEWSLPAYPAVRKKIDNLQVRWVYLIAGAVFSLLAFLTLGGNRFNLINLLLWISGIVFISIGFWKPTGMSLLSFWRGLVGGKSDRDWSIKISSWSIILMISAAVVIFFRSYRMGSVPPEMVSDHAEKLLDIWELINGELRIFFPRNTGREGFQMYLTALVIKVFGT